MKFELQIIYMATRSTAYAQGKLFTLSDVGRGEFSYTRLLIPSVLLNYFYYYLHFFIHSFINSSAALCWALASSLVS
jgi:hypothetical protein